MAGGGKAPKSGNGGTRARACPNCGSPAQADYLPFCSRRCATLDLGRWLNEDYRIASEDEADIDDDFDDSESD